jgi:hypothetical protein
MAAPLQGKIAVSVSPSLNTPEALSGFRLATNDTGAVQLSVDHQRPEVTLGASYNGKDTTFEDGPAQLHLVDDNGDGRVDRAFYMQGNVVTTTRSEEHDLRTVQMVDWRMPDNRAEDQAHLPPLVVVADDFTRDQAVSAVQQDLLSDHEEVDLTDGPDGTLQLQFPMQEATADPNDWDTVDTAKTLPFTLPEGSTHVFYDANRGRVDINSEETGPVPFYPNSSNDATDIDLAYKMRPPSESSVPTDVFTIESAYARTEGEEYSRRVPNEFIHQWVIDTYQEGPLAGQTYDYGSYLQRTRQVRINRDGEIIENMPDQLTSRMNWTFFNPNIDSFDFERVIRPLEQGLIERSGF